MESGKQNSGLMKVPPSGLNIPQAAPARLSSRITSYPLLMPTCADVFYLGSGSAWLIQHEEDGGLAFFQNIAPIMSLIRNRVTLATLSGASTAKQTADAGRA